MFEYVPLVLNSIFVVLSGLLLVRLFSQLPRPAAILLALAVLLSMNFYGLVFTGMEHSLQVLLVLVIVSGLVQPGGTADGRALGWPFFAALLLLPLVRYEGLAISAPVLIYLLLGRDRRPAALTIGVLLIALAAFSLFLQSRGLGWLPSSVLAKTAHTSASSVLVNLGTNVRTYGFLLVVALLVALHRWRDDRHFAWMILAATSLHFLFGKQGWYGRYEVYFVVFIVAVALKFLVQAGSRYAWVGLVLPMAFTSLGYATATTPIAASNIHAQQAQMARITKLLGEKVAVHDLGLVGLRGGQEVLDLWGLGSIEALRSRQASGGDSSWIKAIMETKGVEYAFIYDRWFPQRPSHWIKVGELKLLETRITPDADVVALYATSPSSARKLWTTLDTLSRTTSSKAFAITVRHPCELIGHGVHAAQEERCQ